MAIITTLTHGGQGREYSLTLKPSVISTVGSIEPRDITDLARDWTRSTRLQGGYWTGTFSMPLNKRAFDAFNTWMGCHVEERSGGLVSWEGQVYEMEMARAGVVYRRSFDDMWNRVRVDYTSYTGTAANTGWAVDQASIDRYERKEIIIDSDVTLPDVAIEERDKFLADHAWPWPKAVAVTGVVEEKLTVAVIG